MAGRGRIAGALVAAIVASSLTVGAAAHPAVAQASPFRRGLGLRVTAPSAAAYRAATAMRAAAVGDPPLPASFSLAHWAPPAGDQGQVNSCVSWAIDYTAMGWYLNRHAVDGFPLAPMYTYSQLVHGQNVGTFFEDTFAIAENQGVDARADYAQGDADYRTLPTAAERENASNWKLSAYNTLPVGVDAATTVRAIKTALLAQTPVVLGMNVYTQFYDLAPGHSDLDRVSGPSYGGHAVTALGYDAYGVTIENSWSAAWGNNGFARLSWRFITTQVFAAYAVGPVSATPPTAPHVRGVGPTGGKATGAQHITIVGTNFHAGSTVTFGGVRSPSVLVDASGTRIVATTPPHSPGPVTVNVSGDNGKSPSWAKSRFQFVGAARPTALAPNHGTYRGGTHILIVGTRLNGAGVMIGSTHVRVLSATSNRLVVAAPPGRRGTHANIVLSNAGGSVRAGTFTYL